MAMKLHRDENKNGISVYTVHPGAIPTDITRNWGFPMKIYKILAKPFTKSPSQGAATTVYCTASPETAEISGKYWQSCWDDEKEFNARLGRVEALQEALWEKIDKILDQFEAKQQSVQTVSET
ncbi:unnamed protein product [Heligmosomoides polygyrus]|uniref:Short-chain dehydrogenase/reductase SDR n=1 Tax=Heligmosomoides polygyrus TaxID=6339 RepID=A0A183FP96_HELPZ|nr:unnamed protein product [Heligmosomoides polygyrus]